MVWEKCFSYHNLNCGFQKVSLQSPGHLTFLYGLLHCGETQSTHAMLAELYYNPTVGPLGLRLVEWRMGIQSSLWWSC